MAGLVWVTFALPARAPSVSGLAHGPFDMRLFGTPRTPNASGTGRLVYASSPFGVAVAKDGRARYDIEITATGLPDPKTLGPYTAFVVWATTADLAQWVRLGTVTNGNTTVGPVDFNKFLIVITAEASPTSNTHDGPTVLHGTSPSGWLQTFLSHPLFRNLPQ